MIRNKESRPQGKPIINTERICRKYGKTFYERRAAKYCRLCRGAMV